MKIDKTQITAWKEEYGKIYELPVDDKVAYLRVPKMTDFKRGLKALSNDGEIGYTEVMLNVLWLGGDSEIKEDDTYFHAARKALKELLEFEDAEITSLSANKYEIVIGENKCVVRFITRHDIQKAERSNPSNKLFVTQQKLFDIIVLEKDEAFNDKNNAEIRFPLYKAIEEIQYKKIARLKKH